VRIGNSYDWASVSAGRDHALAIRADGSLWTWGTSWGHDGIVQRYEPTRIGRAHDWVNVSAGGGHNLGIRIDGSLWVWGGNGVFQLGDGTTIERFEPARIGNDFDWESVSAGSSHSLAIKTDGSLWSWGSQFGGHNTVIANYPTRVDYGNTWREVSAGVHHSLGIRDTGASRTNGENGQDHYGIDLGAFSTNPPNHSSDGLWAWGDNQYGQLGDGTNIDSPTPILIIGGTANNIPSITGIIIPSNSNIPISVELFMLVDTNRVLVTYLTIINGRIVHPIGQAQASLEATNPTSESVSFTFYNLQPGTYSIVVTKPGHTSFTINNVVVEAGGNIDLTQDPRFPEVLPVFPGDINGDGYIDALDLTLLRENWGLPVTDATRHLDLNGDGYIDALDLALLREYWGRSAVVR